MATVKQHYLQIQHPSAWKGTDFSSEDDYAFDLDQRHLDALDHDLNLVKQQGKRVEDLTTRDFPLSSISSELAQLQSEIMTGRGLLLIRGFPVEDYDVDDLGLMYTGLANHFGKPLSQSNLGDRLGYVTHDPDLTVAWRGYRSDKELNLHTDAFDIVSLLCIRAAKEGGHSRLTSALTVYNEIVAARPDLIEAMVEGFNFHWFGERPPGYGPISEYKIPVLSWYNDLLSCCFLPSTMIAAAKEINVPFPEVLQEGLDLFKKLANRPDIYLQFPLQAGSAFFINNYTVLHARTGFDDWPEKARRRLLLRLWLEPDSPRPVHPNLKRYYDDLKLAYKNDSRV
ncbi:MAG: TauD/TfdA family dioxygenase [Chloroflexota bacterium]